jgi:GNAT superfamily N-acetyltransferase
MPTLMPTLMPSAGARRWNIVVGSVTVKPSSRVERAISADLRELAALRIEQGWHASQTLLWAIQSWERGRHFILRASALEAETTLDPATIVAATSAFATGPVAVIGNVITRQEMRGRGLGRAVMSATLEWLREQGARTVLLDATADGQPLYRKLGFVARERSWFGSAPLAALDGAMLRARAGSTLARLRSTGDLPMVAALDRAAFGGDRLELLRLVASASDCWLYTAGDDAAPDGYLLVRALEPPHGFVRLGPWIATTSQAGAALLESALRADAPWRAKLATLDEPQVTFSTSAASAEALALFQAAGGALEEDDVVMRLDFASSEARERESAPANAVAEHPDWLYSWLAAMVF